MKPSGGNWGGAYDHITDEFILAELDSGKSVAQFEREQNIPRGVARKLFASRGIRRPKDMNAERLIGNRRTPIPKVDREVTKANGDVKPSYFLTPEEIAEKFKDIKPLKEKPPIGLRVPTSEEQKERSNRRFNKEEDDMKYPQLTKEFFEKEFAAGKSASQIEKEQGVPRGGIAYYMKKVGVKSPFSPFGKGYEKKVAEKVEQEVEEKQEEAKEEELEVDPVNPSHYNGDECLKAIEIATSELSGAEAFGTGSAIKYLWRWKGKNGAEDLKKAVWYIEKLIEGAGK